MDDLTPNFSQNCVNAYLINGDEKSQLISVNQDYTVSQLRSFLSDTYGISPSGTLLLIDGLLVEEDTVIKEVIIESTPSIHVFYELETREYCLHFQSYSLSTSFPINCSLNLVLNGFNSYLLRCYGEMISVEDCVISYEDTVIDLNMKLSSLQGDLNDIYFFYPTNVVVSRYLQMYAQERQSYLNLKQEMDKRDRDIDNMINLVDALRQENESLHQQIESDYEVTNQARDLERINQDLQEQVNTLTEQVIDLKRVTRESDSVLNNWQKEKEEMELEKNMLRNQMKTLEIELNEDKKRIGLLHEECESLSVKLNETMGLMEKYKTGYVNIKRRADNVEKRVVVSEAGGLNHSSLSYHLVLTGSSSSSMVDEVSKLKDDIMENEAYSIMVLQITCNALDKSIVDALFVQIEGGLFPKLRTIDMYDCSFGEDVKEALSQWLYRYSFIDVLTPELIQYKVSDVCYSQFCRYISNTPLTSLQKVNLQSCNLGDDGTILLCELISHNYLPKLNTLILDDNSISSIGIDALSLVLTPTFLSKGLIAFSCASNPLYMEGIKPLLVILRNNLHIQSLWLGNIGLSDTGLYELCGSLVDNYCYHLNLLNLVENQLTPAGMAAFTSLFKKDMFGITDFSLGGNSFGDEGLISLLRIMKGTQYKINRLSLRETGLTVKGMKALQKTLMEKDLSFIELALSSNPIGTEGLDYLVEGIIQGGVEPQRLWLHNTELDERACLSINKLISSHVFEKLVLLDIGSNNINNTAFSSIITAILDNNRPLQLEELWIGGCAILDNGVSLITSLINQRLLPRLTTLCIDLCSLTDNCIPLLIEAITGNYKEMKHINISQNNISPEVQEVLKRQLQGIVLRIDV